MPSGTRRQRPAADRRQIRPLLSVAQQRGKDRGPAKSPQ